MSDTGGDWWQKIGGAAGFAALAGVILDKFRGWKKDDKDHEIKIDEIWDRQAKELYDRQQSYIDKLEKRVKDCEAEIETHRQKSRMVESAASYVSRENVDMHNLIHRAMNYKLRDLPIPPEIVAEMQKYDEI